ncbi:MAG: PASTA domain-containing protein, partial [Eubacteriales bacterium]|nr:PASTA domain-containing protein [Eubacteriales bacterium]
TMRQLLQDVAEKGNASNSQVLNYSVGGFSGVSRKFEEDGTTPSRMRVVASYIGFIPVDNPQLVCMLVIDEPQVPYMEASKIAGYWASKIMTDLVQYYGMLPVGTPTKTSTVPDTTGMTARDAVYTLKQSGFQAYTVPSEDAAQVVYQYPQGKTEAAAGSIVILYTSMTTFNDDQLYKPQVVVPNLLQRRRQDAFDALAKLGLVLSFDKTQCTGQIDSQSIEAGTKVDPGTVIYVTFPKPEPSESPDASKSPSTPTPLPEE